VPGLRGASRWIFSEAGSLAGRHPRGLPGTEVSLCWFDHCRSCWRICNQPGSPSKCVLPQRLRWRCRERVEFRL